MPSVGGHLSLSRRPAAWVGIPAVIAFGFLAGRYSSSKPVSPSPNSVLAASLPVQPASYLQPGKNAATGTIPDSQNHVGIIRIDPEKQQMIGVTIATVEKSGGVVQRRFSGTVAAEDQRISRVSVGVSGWVRSTHDASIGSRVKAGETLATIWSPEFISAINSYLVATDRGSVAVKQASVGIDNANLRLRNLGMSDGQISVIGETRKIPEEIALTAPIDGFIISRNLAAGTRFEMGTEFYRIADLSRVWILADFTENEAHSFRPGTEAVITLKQGQVVRARVTDALPQFNPATQTMRLRLDAANPGFELRPDMLVDVQIAEDLPQALTVPAESVIDSGKTRRVFVDRGNGYLEPREVQTGWRLGNRIQIVSGLNAGERVVAAGAFLVDSEARLKSIASASRNPL